MMDGNQGEMVESLLERFSEMFDPKKGKKDRFPTVGAEKSRYIPPEKSETHGGLEGMMPHELASALGDGPAAILMMMTRGNEDA